MHRLHRRGTPQTLLLQGVGQGAAASGVLRGSARWGRARRGGAGRGGARRGGGRGARRGARRALVPRLLEQPVLIELEDEDAGEGGPPVGGGDACATRGTPAQGV